jgi:putative ABC transport system permease protein
VFAPAIDALGRAVGLMRKAPVPLRLACAALSAGRRRAAWGAGAVAVAVALSIAIASLVTSFRDSVSDWTAQSLRSDIVVRPLAGSSGLPVGMLDAAIVDVVDQTLTAADLDPASRVDPYVAARAQYKGQTVTIAGSALRVLHERGGMALLDGEDPRPALQRALDQHEALVNEAGAQRFGWKVGDEVELEARGYKIVRRIAGIVRDYADSAGIVTVDVDDFRGWVPDERPRTIGIHGVPEDKVAQVKASLESALAGSFHVDVLDTARMRAHVLSVFDRTFAITRALQSIAAIVAVIAVLSVLYALVSERRADLALLSAVGAGARQIASVVCLQAGVLGLLGALGGVICGLVIGVVVVKVVNLQSFGWTLAFVQPWGTMLSTILVVAVACTVSGLLPARATLSARPGMELREE